MDSVRPLQTDEALPVSIVAKAAAAMFAAVVFVHLFAGPIEPLGVFVAHALLITAAYTVAFALTFVGMRYLRAFAIVRATPTPVLVMALSAVAGLGGASGLDALKSAGGTLGGVIDVHDDANWLLKLLPLWLVMTAVLYRSERTRLLENELRRLSVSRAQIKTEDEARAPAGAGPRVIEIGSGKAAQTLCLDDVSHIMAVENYCEVHFMERAGRKPLLSRATLASLVQQLPPDFARAHRSYAVNLAHIDSIGRQGRAYAAVLVDGGSVPISRSKVDEVAARWRGFLKAGADESVPLERR